jgi:diguanylate cyclase (GGDEF)-like protein
MFDVDKFKQVNDSLGHFAGDQVLLAVASRCKHILRKIDIIGRYGGDEFAILLPESPLDSAVRAAERLQEGIRLSAIQLPEAPVQVTITQGISVLTRDNSTLEKLMEAADRALIEAKQEGRDLVRVYTSAH